MYWVLMVNQPGVFCSSPCLLLAAACVLASCGPSPGLPGTSLGTYNVSGALVANTCGAGLGLPNPWTFTAQMSEDGTSLYWEMSGGSSVSGAMSSATQVSITAIDTANVDTSEAGVAGPCDLTGTTLMACCPENHRRRFSHDFGVNRRLEGAAIHGKSGGGPMLPATLQFIIAMVAHAINERMARRVDYLHEEVRVLKEALAAATGKIRIDFTAEQRRRLALKGKQLTAEERRACCQIVRPETILAWFRQLAADKYDSSETQVGRPRKARDIRELVLDMARDNPGWGYTKIRDALRGLKIEIGRTTVGSILADAGVEPAPERNRKRTWAHFLKSHWETLYACDFFSVEVLGVFGTVRYMAFFVMQVKTRAVQIAGIRIAPGGKWMKQIARTLLDPGDGFLRNASHLIHDRDPVFTQAWTALLKTGGVTCVPIPARSPNCNPHAERFVKTVRGECLARFVIFGERHMRHLIREFGAHYQTERYHQGLGSQIITPTPTPSNDNASIGAIGCRSRLGGLLNFYRREAA